MRLCKYKDIFGVPGKGIHSTRFMGVAAFDYFGTILLSILFSYFTKIPLVISTIFMFLLGVLLHWLFCVPTAATRFLGLV